MVELSDNVAELRNAKSMPLSAPVSLIARIYSSGLTGGNEQDAARYQFRSTSKYIFFLTSRRCAPLI